jgi:hypothetical protein
MANKEYYRLYYEKNKEKITQRNKEYYQRMHPRKIFTNTANKRTAQLRKRGEMQFIHLVFDKDFNIILILD